MKKLLIVCCLLLCSSCTPVTFTLVVSPRGLIKFNDQTGKTYLYEGEKWVPILDMSEEDAEAILKAKKGRSPIIVIPKSLNL